MAAFRPPLITGKTPMEQIAQLRSYLYQLIPELQHTINTLETETRELRKEMEKLKEELRNE